MCIIHIRRSARSISKIFIEIFIRHSKTNSPADHSRSVGEFSCICVAAQIAENAVCDPPKRSAAGKIPVETGEIYNSSLKFL